MRAPKGIRSPALERTKAEDCDADLRAAIRDDLKASPFVGDGNPHGPGASLCTLRVSGVSAL